MLPADCAWTDAGGVSHHPSGSAKHRRIISLVPSLTETLCAVGGRSKLVGITAFCIFPQGLLKDPAITIVGGTKTVKRDALLGLKPDLLLLNMEENTLEDIDWFKSRVECYCNGVKTVADGIATIDEVASLIGTQEQAAPLIKPASEFKAAVEARVKARLDRGERRPRIFYPIWREPWMTINHDTFIDDHLRTVGGENVFSRDESSRYPTVTMEQIIAARPDVVWLPSEPYVFKEKHKAEFENLLKGPDAQKPRVELVNGDNVCWFGVRQLEGLEYTYGALWGSGPK
jgi:ABC-type Fe3+-hydroxamate transport system substrate-binding protein